MLMDYEQDERARRHFDFKAALYAGLSVGVIFLFVAKGNPWTSLGLPTHLMGRPLFNEQNEGTYVLTGILQMVVSLCYAFIVSALCYRLKTPHAIWAGGAIGLILYGMNYLIFHSTLRNVPVTSEWIPAVVHIAFCMIVAGAYKGFAIPLPRESSADVITR